MIMTEEEELAYNEEAEEEEFEEVIEQTGDMTISLNAMTGNISLNTLRISGRAYGKEI